MLKLKNRENDDFSLFFLYILYIAICIIDNYNTFKITCELKNTVQFMGIRWLFNERMVQMKFNENMLKKLRIFISLGLLLTFAVVLGVSARSLESDAEEHQDIGMHNCDKEGISKVGVKIFVV